MRVTNGCQKLCIIALGRLSSSLELSLTFEMILHLWNDSGNVASG
jgi:hypothetical protein